MIYLKVNNRSENSFGFQWLKPGRLYKIAENKVALSDPKFGTYNGIPKFYFDEISAVEALIECKKRGITVADIKEMK